jgi:hypothetical protein
MEVFELGPLGAIPDGFSEPVRSLFIGSPDSAHRATAPNFG